MLPGVAARGITTRPLRPPRASRKRKRVFRDRVAVRVIYIGLRLLEPTKNEKVLLSKSLGPGGQIGPKAVEEPATAMVGVEIGMICYLSPHHEMSRTDRVRRIGRGPRNTYAKKDVIPPKFMHEISHRTRDWVVRGPQDERC